MNYDEIHDKFVSMGKGKVQAIRVIADNSGKAFILKYKAEGKYEEITCKTREDIDKILIQYGGNNTETCSAADKFLTVDGAWNSDDLNELGHRITKIQLQGMIRVKENEYPIRIPDECGFFNVIGARPKNPQREVTHRQDYREHCTFTLSFRNRWEADALFEFILSHMTLQKLTWFVRVLGTESRDTGESCVWKRGKSGDGTQRMILQLQTLDGKHFHKCVRGDLFNAAGDMADVICKQIKVRKIQRDRTVCMFAAEDGKVDLTDRETAV